MWILWSSFSWTFIDEAIRITSYYFLNPKILEKTRNFLYSAQSAQKTLTNGCGSPLGFLHLMLEENPLEIGLFLHLILEENPLEIGLSGSILELSMKTNFGMALLSLLVALDLWYHWRYLCPHITKRNTLTNWFYAKIMNLFLHSLNLRLQRPFMEEVRPDFSGKWRNLEKFPRSCFKWDISDYNEGGRVPCERRPPINNRHWPRCVWSLCFSHISERSYNHASHAWWST